MLADAGRLVLVMDGWNELDPASRKRLRAEIQGMQRDYPSLGIVMSTRVQALDVPISGPVVEIEPLSETQQLLIAALIAVSAGEGILDEAWRTRGLRDLVAIPLYLTKLLSRYSQVRIFQRPRRRSFASSLLRLNIRNADKRETLGAVTFGFHAEMLSAIATGATLADSVSVSKSSGQKPYKQGDRSTLVGRADQFGATTDAVLTSSRGLSPVGAPTTTASNFSISSSKSGSASHEVETLTLAAAAGDDAARQRAAHDSH